MLLDTKLLEFDKLGASGLQVESTPGLVGDALLAGTHDERHEGRRLDLKGRDGMEVTDVCCALSSVQMTMELVLQVGRSRPRTGHMCR